eukprot:CAMPEP_0204917972 /NCGR_PEP_ID=MMETSP1397-20131031/15689_1 /ASSEMBLY_ACC=CAM_ASM_000891 /TAXON_ID=49980 /ORGANISM="Climacostomum Climacostomum virens, Strain Stock W-24" /LENGTH=552 /DNA_ID=CAMNT_0052091019 /DNA_START=24 /DNA_END=1682 /DNA_ORIENTATION=-
MASYVVGPKNPLLSITIGQALRNAANKWGSNLACVFSHEDERWTYSELLQRSEELAKGLMNLGLPRKARVGIYAPNCKEWVLTQFAATLADLVLVNINPAYQVNELEYVMNNVKMQALITATSYKSSDYLKILHTICPELDTCPRGDLTSARVPSLKHVVRLGTDLTPGMLNFKDLLGQSSEEYQERSSDIDCMSATNIQFTSGTTGRPKGATLTHHNILNNGNNVGALLNYTPEDKICIQVPLYHCFGMVMGNLACLSHGSTMVFPDFGFNPIKSVEVIEKERCTAVYGVPTMFLALLREQERMKKDVSSLRAGITAGSLCGPELMTRIEKHLKIKDMTNCYGMTETSPVSFQIRVGTSFDKKCNTVGTIHPNGECKLVDSHGNVVPREVVGEICTRGYFVMQGYWGNEKATAEAIDSEGWMHTGDLGVLDEDGFLTIVGRNKDMIIRGGENIYPSEVENYLNSHPDIEDAQVFGIPSQYFGEEVCVWIRMMPGKPPIDRQQIKDFCQGNIAHYKIPTKVKVVESFPLTVTGKVMKYVMRAQQEAEERGVH